MMAITIISSTSEKPSMSMYLELKDAYKSLNKFDYAVKACSRALEIKPNDSALADEMRDLSAQMTMQKGKYGEEGDFRKSIKDREGQEKLHAQAGVVKTEDYRQKAVEDARKRLAQNPDLPANIFDVAEALSDLENDQAENDAIALLEKTYQARSDFSFKQRAGLLRMKQLRRKIRKAKSALDAHPDDAQAKAVLEQLSAQLNSTELEHYQLCTKNYPTDHGAKFKYAVCLVRNERYDEAIPLFQEAQKDPRRKIAAMNQIGFCFFKKGTMNNSTMLGVKLSGRIF